MKTAQLGNEVRDLTSGITGIAVYKAVSLNGNIRLGVQPKAKDDARDLPNCLEIDVQSVEIIGEGKEPFVRCVEDTGIELGQEVQDIVTNMRGTVVKRYDSLSGCVQYAVQPKGSGKDLFPQAYVIDYAQLKVVGKGVMADVQKAIESANTKMTKASRSVLHPTSHEVTPLPPGAPRGKGIRM